MTLSRGIAILKTAILCAVINNNILIYNIMANYSIKANLLKLKGAFFTNLKGRTTTKRCLIIPVDDAGLYVGEKGIYINLTAIELQNPQYQDTHCVKVSYDRDTYEKMTEEERNSLPILGGMRKFERQASEMNASTQLDANQSVDNYDDLPF